MCIFKVYEHVHADISLRFDLTNFKYSVRPFLFRFFIISGRKKVSYIYNKCKVVCNNICKKTQIN